MFVVKTIIRHNLKATNGSTTNDNERIHKKKNISHSRMQWRNMNVRERVAIMNLSSKNENMKWLRETMGSLPSIQHKYMWMAEWPNAVQVRLIRQLIKFCTIDKWLASMTMRWGAFTIHQWRLLFGKYNIHLEKVAMCLSISLLVGFVLAHYLLQLTGHIVIAAHSHSHLRLIQMVKQDHELNEFAGTDFKSFSGILISPPSLYTSVNTSVD